MSLPIGPLLVGAAIGAVVTYILTQKGGSNPFQRTPLEKGMDTLEKGVDNIAEGASNLVKNAEKEVDKAASAVKSKL